MKRTLSNCDRLRALVRSPKYLEDLRLWGKGYSQTETAKFLEKYKISFVVTPELVETFHIEQFCFISCDVQANPQE